MKSAFDPDLNILQYSSIFSPNSISTHRQSGIADLFGALIRRNFHFTSKIYNEIENIKLSLPILEEDGKQPELSYIPKSYSLVQSKVDRISTSPQSHHKITPELISDESHDHANNILNIKLMTEISEDNPSVRPYFSFVSRSVFHSIYYGHPKSSNLLTISDTKIISLCILALQGFESYLFNMKNPLYDRVVIEGNTHLSTTCALKRFQNHLIIRKLLDICLIALNQKFSSPLYTALNQVVNDIIHLHDTSLSCIAEKFLQGTSNISISLTNIISHTTFHRKLMNIIVYILFPTQLYMKLMSSTADEPLKVYVKYLIQEIWISHFRTKNDWQVLSSTLELLLKYHKRSSSAIVADVYPTEFFNKTSDDDHEDDEDDTIQYEMQYDDSYLLYVMLVIIFKKISSQFLSTLSTSLFQLNSNVSIEKQLELSGRESLFVSFRSLWITSHDVNGMNFSSSKEIINQMNACHVWSLSRLRLFDGFKDGPSFERILRIRRLCNDNQANLCFPFHADDLHHLEDLKVSIKTRLRIVENEVKHLVDRWMNPLPKSFTTNPRSLTLQKDSFSLREKKVLQLPIRWDVTTSSEVENKKQQVDPILSNSMKTTSYKSAMRRDSKSGNPIENTSLSMRSYDISLIDEAKSQILGKYSQLIKDVESRRFRVRWSQNRLNSLSQSRKLLRDLYNKEMIIWKTNLLSRSSTDSLTSPPLYDPNIHIQPLNNDKIIEQSFKNKRVEMLFNPEPPCSEVDYHKIEDHVEPSFSGIRVNQAPGGDSNLDLRDNSYLHHISDSFSGIRVRQPPGGDSTFRLSYFPTEATTKDGESSDSSDNHRPITVSESAKVVLSTAQDSSSEVLRNSINEDTTQTTILEELDKTSIKEDKVQEDFNHAVDETAIVASNIEDNQPINKKTSLAQKAEEFSFDFVVNEESDEKTDSEKPKPISIQVNKVRRANAAEVAQQMRKIYLESNSWMNLYSLIFPDTTIIEEQYESREYHRVLQDIVVSMGLEDQIIPMNVSRDIIDFDSITKFLLQPLDLAIQSSIIPVLSNQMKVIDYATVLLAIEQAQILFHLNQIEDIFLISNRSDMILFVCDSLIESYLADYQKRINGTIKASLLARSHRDYHKQTIPSLWNVDHINRVLQMKLKSQFPNSKNATFSIRKTKSDQDNILGSDNTRDTSWIYLLQFPTEAIAFSNGLDSLCINYQIPIDVHSNANIKSIQDTIFSRDVLDNFGMVTTRLLELGQLKSLCRLLWQDLHSYRLFRSKRKSPSNTDSDKKSNLRQLYYEYNQVQAIVQSICDFTGDRLRVQRLKLEEKLFENIQGYGMAGLVASIRDYSIDVTQATLSTINESIHMDNSKLDFSQLELSYSVEDIREFSTSQLLKLLLATCRRSIRKFRHLLSPILNQSISLSTQTGGSSSSSSEVVLSSCIGEMKLAKRLLLTKLGMENDHLNPNQDHIEALMMYL